MTSYSTPLRNFGSLTLAGFVFLPLGDATLLTALTEHSEALVLQIQTAPVTKPHLPDVRLHMTGCDAITDAVIQIN